MSKETKEHPLDSMHQDGAFHIYLMVLTIQSRAALAASSLSRPPAATRLGSVARVTAVLLSLTASSSPAPPDGGLAAPPSKYGSHMGGRSIGSKKKIRHHVNPLKDTHQAKLQLEERWPERLFSRPELPLHVDIGCARGLFCLDLASSSAEANVLGLEIRAALADAELTDAIERIVLFGHPTLTRQVPALISGRPDIETIVVRSGGEDVNPGHAVSTFTDEVTIAPGETDREWLGAWLSVGSAALATYEIEQAEHSPAQRAPDVVAGRSSDAASKRAFVAAELAAVRTPLTRDLVVDAVWRATWPHERHIR